MQLEFLLPMRSDDLDYALIVYESREQVVAQATVADVPSRLARVAVALGQYRHLFLLKTAPCQPNTHIKRVLVRKDLRDHQAVFRELVQVINILQYPS